MGRHEKAAAQRPPQQKAIELWKGPAQVTSTGRIMPISPGRPRKPIDPKQVEKLASYGHPRYEIADILEMNRDTLSERMKEEPELQAAYDRGRSDLAGKVRRHIIRQALKEDPNPATLIFTAKNFAGMSDAPKVVQHVGADGGAIKFVAEWSDGAQMRKEVTDADLGEVYDGEAEEESDQDDGS